MVTALGPRSATSASVACMTALSTDCRCVAMVSVHSLGMPATVRDAAGVTLWNCSRQIVAKKENLMLSITCRSCAEPIDGADEDDLVRRAQEHADGHAQVGGRAHVVSRRHVLAR